MTRTAEQIRDEWLTQLLPSGSAWPRDPDSNLGKLLLALADGKAQLEGDVADLALEISPGTSTLLLADYRAVLGPDPAGRDAGTLTVAEEQQLLFSRWTARGGQSIAYYEEMGKAYGLDITIFEPQATVYGTCVHGDGSVFSTGENDNFVWVVTLPETGTGLEAAILRNRQPDTVVLFRYAVSPGSADLGQFVLGINQLGAAT
ncbi:putative phage tail protein [Gluconobacter potus]|uniref:putative phage tail protein n=1 Tax=Gluconobacter potus TaxID=2724927 RepID=UPI00078650E8|nr:putative phage tail protein [Gluconobacter potus]